MLFRDVYMCLHRRYLSFDGSRLPGEDWGWAAACRLRRTFISPLLTCIDLANILIITIVGIGKWSPPISRCPLACLFSRLLSMTYFENAEIKFFFNLEPTKRYLETTRELTGFHFTLLNLTVVLIWHHLSGRDFTEEVCKSLKCESGSLVVFTIQDNGTSSLDEFHNAFSDLRSRWVRSTQGRRLHQSCRDTLCHRIAESFERHQETQREAKERLVSPLSPQLLLSLLTYLWHRKTGLG